MALAFPGFNSFEDGAAPVLTVMKLVKTRESSCDTVAKSMMPIVRPKFKRRV
jgi:hypothetical protein